MGVKSSRAGERLLGVLFLHVGRPDLSVEKVAECDRVPGWSRPADALPVRGTSSCRSDIYLFSGFLVEVVKEFAVLGSSDLKVWSHLLVSLNSHAII